MKVSIRDTNGKEYDGYIIEASEEDVIHLIKSWKFDWSEIYRNDHLTFKLVKDNKVQGFLKLEWENDKYVIMKNVEVSPSNYGAKGRYTNIAELLISFACLQTFTLNKDQYIGYLVFTSKGRLIDYYQEKYSAELIYRERMIIAPQAALKLIQTHLKLNLRK